MNETLIERLEAMPDRFAAEVDELTHRELTSWSQDTGWNLKLLAAHMRDTERVWHDWLLQILSEEHSELSGVEPDELPPDPGSATDSIGTMLSDWKFIREQTVNTLRGLDSEAEALSAHHPNRGDVTPLQVAELLAEHDSAHFGQALELKGLSREPAS